MPAAVAGLLVARGNLLPAQAPLTPRPSWSEATAGSPLEQYLRVLALDTTRATVPAGARRYDPAVVRAVVRGARAGHPWAQRFAGPDSAGGAARLEVLRPSARAIVNSAVPFGINDGPVWAGRGLTTAVQLGAVARAGPLSLRLEPVAFRAENRRFPLFDESRSGPARFRDPIGPDVVDQPQRFGDGPYQRVDLGQSELRVDGLGLAAGVTNANEVWGPAVTHPLILGTNAAGFLRGFVGTGRPLSVGIGRVQGRLEAGRLEQSAWSAAPDSLRRRLMAGAVASFTPAGPFSGLELGGARFFHRRWTGRVRARDFGIPIEGLLFKQGKFDVDNPDSPLFTPDNQLLSVFARWAFPRAGLDVYGEYARNDAAVDRREFIVEPDHQAAYTLGVQQLQRSGPTRWSVVRAEVVNSRITHLARVRGQDRFYQHGTFVQGHTSRGEVLGSAAVLGGGGFALGWDRYTPDGLRTVELHRILRLTPISEGAPTPRQVDVQYVLRASRTRFLGGVDVDYGAGFLYEPNRDFRRAAAGVLLSAGVRLGR